MSLQFPYYFLSQSYVLYWVSQENKYHILTQSSPVCCPHHCFFFPILITDQGNRGLKSQLSEQEVT